MALRDDLIDISEKEGFRTISGFIRSYIIENNHTFMELKLMLEKKYRRYYSWNWIYIYCHKLVPNHRVSKRSRSVTDSGICNLSRNPYWEDRCKNVGYTSLDGVFRDWNGSLASLARMMDVKYPSLYARYKKWEIKANKKEK